MLYPLKFRPILKSTIWGGEAIAAFKSLSTTQTSIGESWELSGVKGDESIVANGEYEGRSLPELLREFGSDILGAGNYERFGDEFPLLIKFIDACDDLSIQVHPDDELALKRHNSKGKTEMWYVVDKAEGATLRSGFKRELTPEEYVASVENNTITDELQSYQVERGDLFFLPAGRVHSIGAGCFILEVQQTSNITYRIFDFNRTDASGATRELHTADAVGAIDYRVEEDYRTKYAINEQGDEMPLVDCAYFTTSLYDFKGAKSINLASLDSFMIVVCLSGEGEVRCSNGTSASISKGETILIPSAIESFEVESLVGAKILTSYIK